MQVCIYLYMDYRHTTYAYMPVSSYVCNLILDLPINTGRKNSKKKKNPLFSCGKSMEVKIF